MTWNRSIECLRPLAVLVILGCLENARAAEPQIAFVVKEGWVDFTLKQDAEPVSDAQVKIFDQNGHKFAEGETGTDGHGTFPMPTGDLFIAEIQIGERTADPIRICRYGEGVEPDRVLLTFGLRPCCTAELRRKSRKLNDAGTPSETPLWANRMTLTIIGSIAVSCLFAVFLTRLRSRRGIVPEPWRSND